MNNDQMLVVDRVSAKLYCSIPGAGGQMPVKIYNMEGRRHNPPGISSLVLKFVFFLAEHCCCVQQKVS